MLCRWNENVYYLRIQFLRMRTFQSGIFSISLTSNPFMIFVSQTSNVTFANYHICVVCVAICPFLCCHQYREFDFMDAVFFSHRKIVWFVLLFIWGISRTAPFELANMVHSWFICWGFIYPLFPMIRFAQKSLVVYNARRSLQCMNNNWNKIGVFSFSFVS